MDFPARNAANDIYKQKFQPQTKTSNQRHQKLIVVFNTSLQTQAQALGEYNLPHNVTSLKHQEMVDCAKFKLWQVIQNAAHPPSWEMGLDQKYNRMASN